MNLQELGAMLRQERENKGLSLDDVVQATKISRRNIEALEQGREDELPHPVYAKGFLKNYAKLLGLNPDKLGNALTQVYSIDHDDEDVDLSGYRAGGYRTGETASSEPVGAGAVAKVGLALTVLLVLGGVALAGYMVVDGRIELPYVSQFVGKLTGSSATPEKAPSDAAKSASDTGLGKSKERDAAGASAALAPKPAEPISAPLGVPQTLAPSTPSLPAPKAEAKPEVKAEAKPDAKPAEAAKVSEPQKAAAQAVQPEASEAKPAVQPAQPAQDDKAARKAEKEKAAQSAETAAVQPEKALVLEASEECWVTANVDGTKKSASYMLKPGQSLRLGYRKSLALRLGNAGGVSVTLDGVPQPAPGRSGEVVNLKYK